MFAFPSPCCSLLLASASSAFSHCPLSGTDPLADAQTVTKYYPGGRRVDWSLGNDATGAGTYYVSRANKKSKYRPSSLERRATGASGSSPSFNLKNESGIEVATTIHGTPNVDISLIDDGPLVYDLTIEALLQVSLSKQLEKNTMQQKDLMTHRLNQ